MRYGAGWQGEEVHLKHLHARFKIEFEISVQSRLAFQIRLSRLSDAMTCFEALVAICCDIRDAYRTNTRASFKNEKACLLRRRLEWFASSAILVSGKQSHDAECIGGLTSL